MSCGSPWRVTSLTPLPDAAAALLPQDSTARCQRMHHPEAKFGYRPPGVRGEERQEDAEED